MALRVVLYAEGAGETLGELSLPPAPGSPLSEESLGAGHFLVRRAIAHTSAFPEPAIQFESPLRTGSRLAKGSDFLHQRRLRQLLSWPERRPDLAVVMVDADGDGGRMKLLVDHTEGLPVSRVIAVPVQEFEAWLIADHALVSGLLPKPVATPPAPESLPPGKAKEILAAWIDRRERRQDIARSCDLEKISQQCRAFSTFLSDLRACLSRTS